MNVILLSGIVMCSSAMMIALSVSLYRIFSSNSQDNTLKYIGGNIAAIVSVLFGIAMFVLDIALKLGGK